jgi:hypothetical protein
LEVVGLDPDEGMLAEAQRTAQEAGITNAPGSSAGGGIAARPGVFQAATFVQSFHWMDRYRVAAIILTMLEPGGAFVLISDLKQPQPELLPAAPYPAPPSAEIRALVNRYLGPVRRAGQSVLPHGTPSGEEVVLDGAGFGRMERLVVPVPKPIVRTSYELLAWIYSLSYSAPHLFGALRGEFEAELREFLYSSSPAGRFSEAAPDTEVRIFRK